MTPFGIFMYVGMMAIAALEGALFITGIASARLAGGAVAVRRWHKRLAFALLGATVFLVAAVETKIRMDGGVCVVDTLLIAHIAFAVSFALTLVAIIARFNGEKRPALHWKVALGQLIFCLGMIATAVPLVPRLH